MWSLRKKLLVWGAGALAVVIVLATIGVAIVWRHLNGNIKTEDAQLKPSAMSGKQDILFIGSDSRAGANQALGGGDVSGARSDTTMVFDSPADRSRGTEVSIPRDSMVQIPACTSTGASASAGTGAAGATVAANFGMFNSAFTEGGAPCTAKTIESLTGLSLTHYIAIDFEGVVGVVNALGGVEVCVTQAIDDKDSGLDIPAGTTTLNGDQALAFVRLRHSIGDGSDLERIKRQQYFVSRLESQVRAAGLITDPIKLYKVLDAATSSITTDPGLGTVADLYGLAQTLNDIPSGKMSYVTVPNEPYPENTARVIWTEPDATNLWNGLIDEPDSAGASAPASVSPSSAALGQLESVMELELMAADSSADTSDTSAGAGAGANSDAGTASPGGADVGTCPVS
jgi:LCP family protein required for cell wall assembly